MDPDKVLEIIRDCIRIMDEPTTGTAYYITTSERLRDATRDLDEWLTKGGFFPTAWSWNVPDNGMDRFE